MKFLTKLLTLILITLSLNIFGESQSKINFQNRDNLLIQYDSLKSTMSDSSWFSLRNIITLQNKIIIEDNNIIEAVQYQENKFDELSKEFEKLKTSNNSTELELNKKNEWIQWGLYGGAGLFFLLVIFIILFISKSNKAGKLIKQNLKTEITLEEYKANLEKAELKKGPQQSSNNSEEITALKNEIAALKSTNKSIQEKGSVLPNIISDNSDTHVQTSEKEKALEAIIDQKGFEIIKLKVALNQLKNNAPEEKVIKEEHSIKEDKSAQERENYFLEREKDIINKYKSEKNSLSDEISSLRRLLEDEKLYTQELRDNMDKLRAEIDTAKNSTVNEEVKTSESTSDKKKELTELLEQKDFEIVKLKVALNQLKSIESEKITKIETPNTNINKIVEEKENELINKFESERNSMTDEISSIQKRLDDEKRYADELKDSIEKLKDEISALKESTIFQEAEITQNASNENPDFAEIIEQNNHLKLEVEEYKKIISSELEIRKDIIKLIEDLKK